MSRAKTAAPVDIPTDARGLELRVRRVKVRLTNLDKVFWPKRGFTKGDLLRYYASVAPILIPHLRDRAMVMKRYPHGIEGEHFFMKRAPGHRPQWIQTCSIKHGSGSIIDFVMVQDLAALLWVVNLGCIDLNPWYARCDDVDRPDYLHFDLDPIEGRGKPGWDKVCEAALILRDALQSLKIPSYPKTTGSRGIHVYVPIVRGPTQKQVWQFAKALAQALAQQHPKLLTAEYRIAKRPAGRVLVDYNQNAWGRTLASVYSVRPRPEAAVSAPVTWEELTDGVAIDEFRLDTMQQRIDAVGDLFKPMLERRGRVKLDRFLNADDARAAARAASGP